VNAVAEAAGEFFVVPAGKSSRDGGGVAGRENCIAERESFWQEISGFFGLEFVCRNQKHESQILPDCVPLDWGIRGCNAESAESSGRGVVGVAFESGAKLENSAAAQRATGQFV